VRTNQLKHIQLKDSGWGSSWTREAVYTHAREGTRLPTVSRKTEGRHLATLCVLKFLGIIIIIIIIIIGVRGSVVVKALCYKLEGPGFETRRGE
jgi:hypothetical protein